jgi:DNA-binding MarR family transcriptional regulator
VTLSVEDRVLLHLWENDHQADHFIVTQTITRPGIAESCGLHPPNVSRAIRPLLKLGFLSERTRQIRGEDRRQKTWQLTENGREEIQNRLSDIKKTSVLIRDKEGKMLEVQAGEAADRMDSNLSLLQVLMMAIAEGMLQYGDIRLGRIEKGDDKPPPGRLQILAGAHSTYHVRAPDTRTVHGREDERAALDKWYGGREPTLVVSGIAGCGKTTLVSHWLNKRLDNEPNLRAMYYPCQPWDTAIGIATSILHRLGIESKGSLQWDPYGILESLPMSPTGKFDIDMYRRRLTAYLTDPEKIRERVFEKLEEKSKTPPYILLVLDDVHNVEDEAIHLLGSLLQVADQTPLRMLLISRTTLSFYDRRDVHTRGLVSELALRGLSLEEIEEWIAEFDVPTPPVPEEVHKLTGGHPLAVELLEMYGEVVHGDWLRFLDEEILQVLPDAHRDLLAYLAVAERPIPWDVLAEVAGLEGTPSEELLSRGIIIELEDGLWLHEAMRERLLREVGPTMNERRKALKTVTKS